MAAKGFSTFYHNTAYVSIDTNSCNITFSQYCCFITQRGFVYCPATTVHYTSTSSSYPKYCLFDFADGSIKVSEFNPGANASSITLFAIVENQVGLCDFRYGEFRVNGEVYWPQYVESFVAHALSGSYAVYVAENAAQLNSTDTVIMAGRTLVQQSGDYTNWLSPVDWTKPVWYVVSGNSTRLVNRETLSSDEAIIAKISSDGRVSYADEEFYSMVVNPVNGGRPVDTVIGKQGQAFGDSVTAGVGTDPTNPYQYAWPAIASSILGCSIHNLGFGGARITNTGDTEQQSHSFINRLSYIDTSKDFVVIMGGLNDYFNNVALGQETSTNDQEIYGAINILLEWFLRNMPTKCILVVEPFLGYDGGVNSAGCTPGDVDLAWRKRCAYYGVPCFSMIEQGNMGYRVTQRVDAYYPTDDHTHPNRAGQAHIGRVLANFIKNNIC